MRSSFHNCFNGWADLAGPRLEEIGDPDMCRFLLQVQSTPTKLPKLGTGQLWELLRPSLSVTIRAQQLSGAFSQ